MLRNLGRVVGIRMILEIGAVRSDLHPSSVDPVRIVPAAAAESTSSE